MSHHSLLTKMNKSLQTSPENQLLINFKHLIGLIITLGNSHIPRVKLGVSFFVLSFSLVGITYGYKLLHATPKTAMRVQKSKKQNQLSREKFKKNSFILSMEVHKDRLCRGKNSFLKVLIILHIKWGSKKWRCCDVSWCSRQVLWGKQSSVMRSQTMSHSLLDT